MADPSASDVLVRALVRIAEQPGTSANKAAIAWAALVAAGVRVGAPAP